ncbi:hypothetical protein Dimus_033578, partial [Dionaea muscipula]
RKKPSPQNTEESVGDEKSAKSAALLKRKTTPTQSAMAAADDDEGIIDFTVGHEHETVADGATSTEGAPQPVVLDLPDMTLLDNDEPLKENLSALDKLEVTNDEATDEVVKDVALPLQKKRKLTNGVTVATGSETVAADKRKKVTAAMAVVPMAEGQDTTAEKEGRKTRGRGMAGDAKSGRTVLPPSLQLSPSVMSPSIMPIDPSATAPSSRPLAYHSPKWKIMPHQSIVLVIQDKEVNEALRHEWTRRVMTAKDLDVVAKLSDDALSQVMTQAAVQVYPF